MNNGEPLNREQQSLLFALNINPDEVQMTENGHRYYYYHFHFDKNGELQKIEQIFKKLRLRHERINTITNLKTKYTAIYHVYLPKFVVNYLYRGQSESMRKETVQVKAMFEYGYLF